ncbi:hypothetical protein QNI16_07270 [Cytophagaceae bacterium YF14B1]|uniref:Uncharacterized protein n=1 Tax=Xanthocytophaga flava TaxID=3048013 RepID=A0AAE3QP40_9BACT|nr:hypothetical protein [Xanthocytophaga flavus]MDJ1480279.1 hypothetical protein [Xanthocytophaga flavus]
MTIQQWLIGTQDYKAGVELYQKFGKSAVWKNILSQGETEYNRDKLLSLLTELAGELASKPVAAPKLEVHRPAPEPGSLLDKVKSEWVPLYKRMSFLHTQLTHLPAKERGELAFEILSLDKQINQIWKKEKFVQQHGQLPAESICESKAAHDLSTQIGIQKRILNLRSSISKHKKNPKRKADLTEWVREKADLEQQLKTMQNIKEDASKEEN